jgi:hypothetical protein
MLGGIVFAIRLTEVGLPVEEALRAVPRETLVLVGARELLIAGVVAIGLLLLARMIVLAVAVAVGLALVAPLTFAGLAWSAAVVIVLLATRHIRQVMVVAVGTFVLACVLTAVRFTDPPYAFSSVQILRASDPSIGCANVLEEAMSRVCGAYLGRHNDGVYVGNPDDDRIVFVPKETLRAVVLFPPPDHGSPRRSVLGRVANVVLRERSSTRVDLTPLDLWVDGEHKGWSIFR